VWKIISPDFGERENGLHLKSAMLVRAGRAFYSSGRNAKASFFGGPVKNKPFRKQV